MIGKVLGVRVKDRMEGTLALVTIAVAAGADMVRVHDVREMARAARMADALAR
jgi:dihydropteroate synthase